MKIAVFGATGMAGRAIVADALTRGHHVLAASRHTDPAPGDERLSARAVDVSDKDAVDAIMAESDVAVLTIRLAPGHEHELAPLTRGFLDVARRRHSRVLIVGGSAPLRSPDDPDRLLIDDPRYIPEAWHPIARASLDQFTVCEQHPHSDWVYLSPPAIFIPGGRTEKYRRGTTTLLTDSDGVSRITAVDLAIAVLDELEHPGDDQHFTVVEA